MEFMPPPRWNDNFRYELLKTIMKFKDYISPYQITIEDIAKFRSAYKTKRFNYDLKKMISIVYPKEETGIVVVEPEEATPKVERKDYGGIIIFIFVNLCVYLMISSMLSFFILMLNHFRNYLLIYLALGNYGIMRMYQSGPKQFLWIYNKLFKESSTY